MNRTLIGWMIICCVWGSSLCGCRKNSALQTPALITALGLGYKMYLVEGGHPAEFMNIEQDLWPAILEGVNSKGEVYVMLPEGSLNAEGDPIDTWGRTLSVKRLDVYGAKIEIRSAGKDAIMYTMDDIYRVFPQSGAD